MRETEEVLAPGQTFGSVTDKISSIVLVRPHEKAWLIAFGLSSVLVGILCWAIGVLLWKGVGIWGINIPATHLMEVSRLIPIHPASRQTWTENSFIN